MVRILFIASIIVFFNYSISASCNDLLTDKQWYVNAKKYVEADKVILDNETLKNNNFSTNYKLRQQAETNIIQSCNPSNEDIISILDTDDILNLKIALITITLKNIFLKDIVNIVVSNYWNSNDFFYRYYSQLYFKALPKDIVQSYKNDIVSIFLREDNESIILAGLPTLLKFEPCDVDQVYAKYFTSGTKGLKRGSLSYLNSVDKDYLQKLKYCLTEKKQIKALSEIKTLENDFE